MNFIDAFDGLAGGLALITTVGLWIAFVASGKPVSDLILLSVGALTGFMLFNAWWFNRRRPPCSL